MMYVWVSYKKKIRKRIFNILKVIDERSRIRIN
jgi:hypothetical protein